MTCAHRWRLLRLGAEHPQLGPRQRRLGLAAVQLRGLLARHAVHQRLVAGAGLVRPGARGRRVVSLGTGARD